MKISAARAATLLREEARNAELIPNDPHWETRIEHLSRLCEEGVSKTHIAFFGTAILARAVSRDADLFAIKPSHAPDNPHAFSARTLCHGVLVPLATELRFSLGVTGREPLNNQPYFRMTRLDDGTPVHAGGRAAFDYMLELVRELASSDSDAARRALRTFVAVRRGYQPRYSAGTGGASVTPQRLAGAIHRLVTAASEGGKRAQAAVAGLLDAFAGPERVESGRINDPSRHFPGDVCTLGPDGETWERSFEVRDKAVTEADVLIFVNKCALKGIREAAVVMASETQVSFDVERLTFWAAEIGVSLTIFTGWTSLVEQVLFWAPLSKIEAAPLAALAIRKRLIETEASQQAVALWDELTAG